MSRGKDNYSVKGTFLYSPSTFVNAAPSPWCCIKNVPEITNFVGREVSEGQKNDLAPEGARSFFAMLRAM